MGRERTIHHRLTPARNPAPAALSAPMPAPPDADALREIAANRGLRLVRSRRRKPGQGDYGKLGLTDGEGRKLLGFGDDGALTATAEEVAAYLRRDETSTWAESVRATPARTRERGEEKRAVEPAEPPAAKPRRAAARGASRAEAPKARPRQPARPARAEKPAAPPSTAAKAPSRPPEPPSPPKPALVVRPATKADAEASVDLLRLVGGAAIMAQVAAHLAAPQRAREPVLVADLGGVVGCLAWHVVSALRRTPIARITAVVVAERRRRSGVGRALVNEMRALAAKAGATTVEAISGLKIKGPRPFLRAVETRESGARFEGRPLSRHRPYVSGPPSHSGYSRRQRRIPCAKNATQVRRISNAAARTCLPPVRRPDLHVRGAAPVPRDQDSDANVGPLCCH
jgi:N-acetylglutamate synthase-like GNAT family acetyltransferase